jgi:hypothetical protein
MQSVFKHTTVIPFKKTIAFTMCDWCYEYCFHTVVIVMTSILGKYEILECLLKIPGFWDMMPCELIYRYRLVGGAYCLLIQESQITCRHIPAEWNHHQHCEDFRFWSMCAIVMVLKGIQLCYQKVMNGIF